MRPRPRVLVGGVVALWAESDEFGVALRSMHTAQPNLTTTNKHTTHTHARARTHTHTPPSIAQPEQKEKKKKKEDLSFLDEALGKTTKKKKKKKKP